MLWPREKRPFSVDVGAYHGTGSSAPKVDFPVPAAQNAADPAALVVDAPDRLYGFVESTPGGTILTRFDGFAVAAKPTVYDVAQVVFDNPYVQDHYRINLTMASATDAPHPRRMWLHMRAATREEQSGLPKPDPAASASFAPVAPDKVDLTQRAFPAGPWSAMSSCRCRWAASGPRRW